MQVLVDGIPALVQHLTPYGDQFMIRLFNGRFVTLDKLRVREHSLMGYEHWDKEKDWLAAERFVEDYWHIINTARK